MRKIRRSTSHPYSDRTAFERLMILLAALVQYPGIGSSDAVDTINETHHDALAVLKQKMQTIAEQQGISLQACSLPTLRKDLGMLREWGILERRMYRWGYYLGTGAMTKAELQVALNALHSQAQYQNDPQISKIYQRLERRLRSMKLPKALAYPVRTHLDRTIVHTDPAEMMAQGKYRGTLFENLEELEQAILNGHAIQLFRSRNPYKAAARKYIRVYPLQLIYSDVAWYLLHEDCQNKHLAISRVDRFSEHFQHIEAQERDEELQWHSLQAAHQLLENGWGLSLGSQETQQLERQGNLPFTEVTVRFFPRVMGFILEGTKRHPSQTIRQGPKAQDGSLKYVDYTVRLPPRSFNEFCYWVCRFMGNTQFLSPPELVEKHRTMAHELIARYTNT